MCVCVLAPLSAVTACHLLPVSPVLYLLSPGPLFCTISWSYFYEILVFQVFLMKPPPAFNYGFKIFVVNK